MESRLVEASQEVPEECHRVPLGRVKLSVKKLLSLSPLFVRTSRHLFFFLFFFLYPDTVHIFLFFYQR